ncbi:DUF1294 domain-containing protein [Erysipelothrix sp. HDW6C]|uniref:DUF1294 domain-containing protein n=1 Tax=Erysipelothrix sp. HDW6C TaxID=2714930 RepID=UPI0014081C75|nr:DUF1294 domain-containing protein [Erysipelothrix sp. HDW6C]QIK70568.1 DUF1294 domain-containing protein [Erysipelothrix sp. HDW6C]
MKYYLIFVICLSILATLLMRLDKRNATQHRMRISEITFVYLAFLGGFPGILMGGTLFHHKTKKRTFQLKIIFAALLHGALAYSLLSLK